MQGSVGRRPCFASIDEEQRHAEQLPLEEVECAAAPRASRCLAERLNLRFGRTRGTLGKCRGKAFETPNGPAVLSAIRHGSARPVSASAYREGERRSFDCGRCMPVADLAGTGPFAAGGRMCMLSPVTIASQDVCALNGVTCLFKI